MGPRFRYAWDTAHVRLLTEKLMAVERGEIKRLMVFMPPRHRKSQVANAHFSAWYLGRNPDHHIITASYGDALAKRFSRQTRNLVREFGPALFGIDVSSESGAVEYWQVANHYGGFAAVGVGGPITGTGADLLIIDDPHKNRQEANSQTIRDQVWDWYTNDATTRLEPNGAIILIQTRWHPDDLAGRLLKAQELGEGDEWEVVRLPALAEADDPLGRAEGEPLWPARYGAEKLAATRRRMGSFAFTALYQQRPQELHGGAFQAAWFQWYHADDIRLEGDTWYWQDQPLTVVFGVDPATTAKSTSDDFALVVLGMTPQMDVLVLDVIADPTPIGEQLPLVVEQYRRYAPDRITVEDNQGQAYFVHNLKTWHRDKPGVTPLPVKAQTSTGAKYDRITRNVPLTEDGHVYLRSVRPEQDGWVDLDRLPGVKMHRRMVKLYQQLVTLNPAMEHDDAADAWDLAISGTRARKFFADHLDS